MSHTKGPWLYSAQGNVIKSASGEFVVGCNGVTGWNVHLLAAAPSMLDVLERTGARLQDFALSGRKPTVEALNEIQANIWAVLEQARGL